VKTLSARACSAWLAERGISEAPYGSPQSDQCPLPQEAGRSSSLVRDLVAALEPFGSALLHFTDWPLYEPHEMAVVSTLRIACGDHYRLIDSPGHVFSFEERDLLTGMFSLAAFYHWSAYLYFDHQATLYCWEGDLLDLWVSEKTRLCAVREVFAGYGLSSTLVGAA
jgi:hypothetical protein